MCFFNYMACYFSKPRTSGNHRDRAGIKLQIISVAIMATKKGIILGIIFVTVVSPMPHPRNKQVPTGGVHRPIQRFIIMMIPKCSG